MRQRGRSWSGSLARRRDRSSLLPRHVVPRSGTDTALEVRFPSTSFKLGETKALRLSKGVTKTSQGSWFGATPAMSTPTRRVEGRNTFTCLRRDLSISSRERFTSSDTATETRLAAGQGTPGPWSEIGEGATSGGGISLLRFPDGESATTLRYYRSDDAIIDATNDMELE